MKFRFELEPVSSDGMGIARLLFFSVAVITIPTGYFESFSNFAGAICAEKSGILSVMMLGGFAPTIGTVFKITAVLSAIGLATRLSMWIAFLSLFALNANALLFCYLDHRILPYHVAMLLWAMLDSSSSFRIDNLLRKSKTVRTDSESALLPLLMRSYFCVIFFLSGWAKIRFGGWNWIASDTLRHYIMVQNYALEGRWAHPVFLKANAWIVGQPLLCQLLAFMTVAVEVAAPLALLKSKLRNWIIADLAMMQIGIFVVMYINFMPWAALYVFWLPLNQIGRLVNNASFTLKKINLPSV